MPVSQISLPLEAVFSSLGKKFKQINYYSQWQHFSFEWKQYSFIHIFLETIIAIRGRPIFLKNLVSARRNRFLYFFIYFFLQILIQMEVAFRSSEITFSLVETDFRLITNFVLLFRAFLCWCTQFFKLGVNQFSSIFSIANSGSSFSD